MNHMTIMINSEYLIAWCTRTAQRLKLDRGMKLSGSAIKRMNQTTIVWRVSRYKAKLGEAMQNY